MINEELCMQIPRVLKRAKTWINRSKLFAKAAKKSKGDKKAKYYLLMQRCCSEYNNCMCEYNQLFLADVGGPRDVDRIRIPSED